MKECSKCGENKPLEEFSWRNKSKGQKNTWCRLCMKAYDSNRQKSKVYINRKYELVKIRQDAARLYIWEILCTSKCVDCGNNNPIVLQFDHRNPTDKHYNVSEMLDCSISKIQKEIDKCDIRCANCHVIRTANQFGFWKALQ